MLKLLNKFKVSKQILLTFTFTAFFLAGCSDTDTKDNNETDAVSKEQPNLVRVGTSGNYFPFSFSENGELKGFEIDVWKEIAKRLNGSVEFCNSTFFRVIWHA